jgi:hypothetical protein
MGFIWNNFGKLKETSEDEKYLYITNYSGQSRKISKFKYSSSIPVLRQKINMLIDKECIVRTSQNTSNWSTDIWFSEISINGLAQQIVNPNHQHEDDLESVEELKRKLQITEMENRELKQENFEQSQINNQQTAVIKQKEEKYQDLRMKHNEVQGKYADLEVQYAKLKSQFDEEFRNLSDSKKNEVTDESIIVSNNIEIGAEYGVITADNSHARRTMALRLGVVLDSFKKRVSMKIIAHLNRNNYHVQLVDYKLDCAVSLGFNEGKGFFCKSFQYKDPIYFDVFEKVIGKPDALYKDRLDLSLEEFADIYKKVEPHLV